MESKHKYWLWFGWIVCLVFIFPIPGTIALRNLILFSGLLALVIGCRRNLPVPVSLLGPAAWGLALLTGWIGFHSATIAFDPANAFDQLRSNWINQILIAVLAAWAAKQLPAKQCGKAIVVGLAAHIIWLLAHQLQMSLLHGNWPFKATPFAAYDYHGMLNSFFLALVIADRIVWLLKQQSPFDLGRGVGWSLLAISIAADMGLQSRNSTLVDIGIVLAAGAVVIRTSTWRASIALVCMFSILIGTALVYDQRWQGLVESARIGWTSDSPYWLTAKNEQRPVVANGATLEESAYFRVAWAKQSVEMISEAPLGSGFGHDAFGRRVAQKYGLAGMGSSHSGWLDFAIGTGLPGIALLLIAGGLAVRAGGQRFFTHNDGAGLAFAFLVGSYLFRCLLDGHLSGWRLSLFGFLCGILISAMRTTNASDGTGSD